MQVTEQQVTLIKLVAGEGKIIVSKTLDDEGNPTIKSKEVYIPSNADVNDFEEVDYIEEVQEEAEEDMQEPLENEV